MTREQRVELQNKRILRILVSTSVVYSLVFTRFALNRRQNLLVKIYVSNIFSSVIGKPQLDKRNFCGMSAFS